VSKRGREGGRGLRLRPIYNSPDITNELLSRNVGLTSDILIITHAYKKTPHQSNWILERKWKMSKAINSSAALFVCRSGILIEE